jgi:hypothetical protein
MWWRDGRMTAWENQGLIPYTYMAQAAPINAEHVSGCPNQAVK